MRVSSILMASETDRPIPANTFAAATLMCPSIRARTTSLFPIASLKLFCSHIVALAEHECHLIFLQGIPSCHNRRRRLGAEPRADSPPPSLDLGLSGPTSTHAALALVGRLCEVWQKRMSSSSKGASTHWLFSALSAASSTSTPPTNSTFSRDVFKAPLRTGLAAGSQSGSPAQAP